MRNSEELTGTGLGLILVVLALAGCGGEEPPAPGEPPPAAPPAAGLVQEVPEVAALPTLSPSGDGGRTLVVAVDGLEWDVLLPMAIRGYLPVISDLMKRGRAGRLETLTPTISQILWTSAVTGKSPEKHGIDELLAEAGGERGARLFSSADRKTKAVWNIFSDAGLTSHTVGWWKAYPAETVTGTMIPQLNILYAFDTSGLGVYEADRAGALPGLVHPEALRGFVEATAGEVEGKVSTLAGELFGGFRYPHSPLGGYALPRMRWVLGMDEMHRRIAVELLSSGEPWSLAMVYFRGADVLSHAFWRFSWPQGFSDPPTREERHNYGGLIPNYYRHMDKVIGELAAAAGPETTLVILSDHGMGPIHLDGLFSPGGASPPESKSGDHETAPPGIFIAAGPMVAAAQEAGTDAVKGSQLPMVGSILDLAPTLLVLAGLPVGEDMDGRPLIDLLEPAFLADHPVTAIATHDAPGWRQGDQGYRFTDEQILERIEELRSIGYIE